jgi:hypothetical protein
MIENWKEIENYEGMYEVSDFGRIRSMERTINSRFFPSVIIAQSVNSGGYLRVTLNHPVVKKKTLCVHVLVGKAYVPNLDKLPVLNHKNGNKLDNRASELEWTTHSGNTQHAYDTGLKKKGAESCNARIVMDTQTGIFYLTVQEAAETFSINQNTLFYKLSGKRRNNTSLILT